MFRFKSAERLRAIFTSAYPKRLFRPNALLRSSSPALMYSSRGGGVPPSELPRSVVRLTCESTAKGGICNVYLIEAFPPVNSTIHRLLHPFKDNEEDFLEDNEEDFLERNVKVAIESLKPQMVFKWSFPRVAHDLKQDEKLMRIVHRLYDQKVIPKMRVVYVCLFGFFVNQRAQYMVSADLLKVARKHTTVVAVVSNLHLPGIKKYWKYHIKVEDLLSRKWPVPPSVTISVALLLLYLLYSHVPPSVTISAALLLLYLLYSHH